MAPRRDARGARPAAGQRAAAGQGQHRVAATRCASRLLAGAGGFKLHEDWGSTPAAIDACLRVADEIGVQVAIHTDTPQRGGLRASRRSRAIAGRSIHAFHTEGAGGGHAPDIITHRRRSPTCCPSSTNPTRPHTVNTVAEHLDMLIVCHHLNPRVPEDLAFAESRIRATTIAAEDVLHDLGAISMIGSDSQAMGRIGEAITRTWQTAHVMKARRGPLGGDGAADNERARRYVAKYTICPAVAHGIDARGRLGRGRASSPTSCCGTRRSSASGRGVVIKGGAIAWAPMGDPNASIPTPQPVLMRPMFAGAGRPRPTARVTLRRARRRSTTGWPTGSGCGRRLVAGRPTRARSPRPTWSTTTRCPTIDVDPETFRSTIDGEVVEPEPADRAARWPSATRCSDDATWSDSARSSLLADAPPPAGGHAHSGGLEAALAGGLDRASPGFTARRGCARSALRRAGAAVAAAARAAAASAASASVEPPGPRRDARAPRAARGRAPRSGVAPRWLAASAARLAVAGARTRCATATPRPLALGVGGRGGRAVAATRPRGWSRLRRRAAVASRPRSSCCPLDPRRRARAGCSALRPGVDAVAATAVAGLSDDRPTSPPGGARCIEVCRAHAHPRHGRLFSA